MDTKPFDHISIECKHVYIYCTYRSINPIDLSDCNIPLTIIYIDLFSFNRFGVNP